MRFSCDGCGKRYATAEQPAPGRVFRVTCTACGHLVEVAVPGRSGEPVEPALLDPPLDDVSVVEAESIDTEPSLGDLPPPPEPAAPEAADAIGPEAASPPAAAGLTGVPATSFPRPRATPVPRKANIPDLAAPPRRRRTVPIVVIAAGVAALLAILAFVLLGGARSVSRPAAPAVTAAPPPPTAAPAPPVTVAPAPVAPAPRAAAAERPGSAPAKASRDARERDRRDRRRDAAGLPAALTPQQIQKVLASSRHSLDRCVQSAGRSGEVELDGRRVVLRLRIQRTGAVTSTTLDDATLGRTKLGTCLKTAARQLTFPRFDGEPMHVEVPLVLARGR